MRKPEKPGTQDSKTQEGGALGNIDEQTGHPGKGTSGATMRPRTTPTRRRTRSLKNPATPTSPPERRA